MSIRVNLDSREEYENGFVDTILSHYTLRTTFSPHWYEGNDIMKRLKQLLYGVDIGQITIGCGVLEVVCTVEEEIVTIEDLYILKSQIEKRAEKAVRNISMYDCYDLEIQLRTQY